MDRGEINIPVKRFQKKPIYCTLPWGIYMYTRCTYLSCVVGNKRKISFKNSFTIIIIEIVEKDMLRMNNYDEDFVIWCEKN